MEPRFLLITASLLTVTLAGCTTPESTNESAGTETRLLEVIYWNDTETNPPSQDTEIWVRGHGSWFLMQEPHNPASRELGEFPVDETQDDAFYIYPDGRDGSECQVSFQMTEDMHSGSTQAMTEVSIEDTQVMVRGQAIPDSPHTCPR